MQMSSRLEFARKLVATLPAGLSGIMNPYRDHSADDLPGNSPEDRVARLAEHLSCEPDYILCGEAPGYQGCRVSGIAFTSERQLLQGLIPNVGKPNGRLSSRRLPWSEPAATMVWETLKLLGIADRTVLWNAVQVHPHKPGEKLSNRKPSPHEVSLGAEALRFMRKEFPTARFIAVGQVAEGAIRSAGIDVLACVRHPSFGGKAAFVSGLTAAIRSGV